MGPGSRPPCEDAGDINYLPALGGEIMRSLIRTAAGCMRRGAESVVAALLAISSSRSWSRSLSLFPQLPDRLVLRAVVITWLYMVLSARRSGEENERSASILSPASWGLWSPVVGILVAAAASCCSRCRFRRRGVCDVHEGRELVYLKIVSTFSTRCTRLRGGDHRSLRVGRLVDVRGERLRRFDITKTTSGYEPRESILDVAHRHRSLEPHGVPVGHAMIGGSILYPFWPGSTWARSEQC